MNQALIVLDPVLAASNGGLFKTKRRMHPGRWELTATKLVFYQRSMWWMAFGLIGALISRGTAGKRTLDVELAQVASIARGKYGFNKKILDLTMRDGTAHRLCVERFDDFSAGLRAELARHGAASWKVCA